MNKLMTIKHTPKKYALEIFQLEREGYASACVMESDEPFMGIHVGDTLNPSTWNFYCFDNVQTEYGDSAYGIVLKVTGVEHLLVQRENGTISQHKVLVFAVAVENNYAALFGGDDGANLSGEDAAAK